MAFDPKDINTETERLFRKGERIAASDSGVYQYPDNLGTNEAAHWIMINIFETVREDNTTQSRPISNGPSSDAEMFSRFQTLTQQSRGQTVARRESAPTGTSRVLGSTRELKRARESIALYMPMDITTSYGTNWEMGDVNTVVGGIGTAKGIYKAGLKTGMAMEANGADVVNTFGSSISGAVNKVTDTYNRLGPKGLVDQIRSSDLAKQATLTGLSVGSLAGVEGLENALSANLRLLRNPHMEFLFKGVNQRTFNFQFTFTPKSAREADTVRSIIKLLKYHQHPEVKAGFGGVFYDYPSEFELRFFSHGKENNYLHKMSTCALTGMSVTYTGAGVNAMHTPVSLNAEGSPPVHTIVTLSFTELELMSRQRIEQGF